MKIAFFDIDGTLIPFGRHRPTKRVRSALEQLRKNGILVFACSGRPGFMVPDLGFDGIIANNGAIITLSDGTVLSEQPLNRMECQAFIQLMKKRHIHVTIAGKNRLLLLPNKPIYQMMCPLGAEEANEILEPFPGLWATGWSEGNCDIQRTGTSKGSAIRKVLAHYGLNQEDSVAFGDGLNDLNMFEAAGLSVAMDNAPQPVKERADRICPSAKSDGVYVELVRLGLISRTKK